MVKKYVLRKSKSKETVGRFYSLEEAREGLVARILLDIKKGEMLIEEYIKDEPIGLSVFWSYIRQTRVGAYNPRDLNYEIYDIYSDNIDNFTPKINVKVLYQHNDKILYNS